MPSTSFCSRVTLSCTPVVWFVTGLVAGGVGALTVTSANAADESYRLTQTAPAGASKLPKCLRDGDYGTFIGEENRAKRGNKQISGTRSRVWVPPKGTHCQRISSVYGASKRLVDRLEFGVVVGWSNCTDKEYKKPRVFAWATKKGEYLDCAVGERVKPKQYDTFSVSDKNHNGKWGPYLNGRELLPSGVRLGFRRGISYFGVERGSRKDSCTARFHTLREHHDGWSKWDHLKKSVDTDPRCRLVRNGNSSAKVAPGR